MERSKIDDDRPSSRSGRSQSSRGGKREFSYRRAVIPRVEVKVQGIARNGRISAGDVFPTSVLKYRQSNESQPIDPRKRRGFAAPVRRRGRIRSYPIGGKDWHKPLRAIFDLQSVRPPSARFLSRQARHAGEECTCSAAGRSGSPQRGSSAPRNARPRRRLGLDLVLFTGKVYRRGELGNAPSASTGEKRFVTVFRHGKQESRHDKSPFVARYAAERIGPRRTAPDPCGRSAPPRERAPGVVDR
jgi:hypothetical protein